MPTTLAPPAEAPTPLPRHRRRWPLVVGGVLAVLLIAAVAYHLVADASYRASFDRSRALAARADAAAKAASMEPFNPQFTTRAKVMHLWSHASVLLSQDAALPAMLELADAYRLDVGDTELLALFQRAQQQLSYDTNRKAHLQHGHEGPGGTLRPQDLLR